MWLPALFPQFVTSPLAEHHHELWRWVWAVEPGVRPEALIGVINRAGAKSTTAELAAVALGARGKRKYLLYVCETQDQADDHVQNIAGMLESTRVAEYYPELGQKLLNKHGHAKGWRRNRIRTASGFTIDALGLDSAARGIKLDEQRPDAMVIDDVDRDTDSPRITAKKIATLTRGLIPSGAEDLAVIAIQNLIHANSVFARLVSGAADYLRRRKVIGPIPALKNFAYRQRTDGTYQITSGEPTWEGFDLARCEALFNDIGPRAFRAECQHDVAHVEGAYWIRGQLDASRVSCAPDLSRVVTFVDPSGGTGDGNDEQGIIVAGLGVDGHGYILADRSCKMKPHGWGTRAVQAHHEFEGDGIRGEPNFGGDMVASTIKTIDPSVPYKDVHAARGKKWRAEPVAALFGDAAKPEDWDKSRVHIVDVMPELEDEFCTWFEGCGWSPNRADAMWGAITELMLNGNDGVIDMDAHKGSTLTGDLLDKAW